MQISKRTGLRTGLFLPFLHTLMAVLFMCAQSVRAEQPHENFFDLELEDLLKLKVTSVSKRAETIMEAPSAVYTISAEDIKYSGAKKITDVFRLVPGVDVADVNSFYSGVQSRGFSFFPKYARQMLVLVDGRTVYSPQINATFWDQIPLFLENIERVEVVRGPNAALYGANAFNGVINIITRDPQETRGVLFSATAGNRESQWSLLRLGGSAGSLSYRLTAGYHETKGFSSVHDDTRKPQITLRGDYKIDGTSSLSLRGGYVGGNRQLAAKLDPGVTSFFLAAKYEKNFGFQNRLLVQYYHDYRNSALTLGYPDKLRANDLEIQLDRHGSNYSLVCGAGYRIDQVRHGFLSGEHSTLFTGTHIHHMNLETDANHIFKAFGNYTFRITGNFHLTAALMVEHNGFVGTTFSPKGSLLYLPEQNHSFRLSVSRAFRTPSFIEEKADFTLPFPRPPFYLGQKGDSSLDPEEITAFELGYRGLFLNSRLSINIEAFYHIINDVIIYEEKSRRNILEYDNLRDNHVRGVEAAIVWKVADWWRLTFNYAYQKAGDSYLKGLAIQQKASFGNRFRFPYDIVLNCQLYYVDRFHFEDDPWVASSTVKDYTRLDARLSKAFLKRELEIALIGQNLLDPRHYEYPRALSAGEANRTFYLELSYRFNL